jgi:hypothetical protein
VSQPTSDRKSETAFDIAFLDISMPSYEKGIYSGEDLAKLILENMPIAKLFC